MHISRAAYSVANCVDGSISLIAKLQDAKEQDAALSTLTTYAGLIANIFGRAAQNHYMEHSTVDDAFSECVDRIVAAHSIFSEIESSLKKHFPAKIDAIVSLQKAFNQYLSDYGKYFNAEYRTNITTRLANEIKQYDASYVQPTVNTGGCYVATAVYGSYDCPQVWTLRRFRDHTLTETWYGRTFIRVYYAISPTLVKLFGKAVWFKNLWKPVLDRMVESLNESGIEDTPYNDRECSLSPRSSQ